MIQSDCQTIFNHPCPTVVAHASLDSHRTGMKRGLADLANTPPFFQSG